MLALSLTFFFFYRGTRFTLSRDELLTLPEFVLLSLFPNGLLPDGHMGFAEGDVYPVDVGAATHQRVPPLVTPARTCSHKTMLF